MTTTRGQHLIGKEIGSCVLERLLGYGGSSAVFLARSLTSDEQVAVKVFLPRSTLDGQMRKSFYQRFLREAEAASQLDHPHILSVFAYGEHEGMPYIVMPYMAGGTLSEYLHQHGPLSLEDALRYLEQIAAALDYAHEHNCVHCDVKPANILLDTAGNAELSDFGIVHMLQDETAGNASAKGAPKKSSETLMGTPDYVSPEQALGEKLDGRSDVYSLGATLYALLTGEPPFKADTPIALALMHVHEAPTPIGLLRSDVTPQIDAVISKALAKWPKDRFQSAGAFALAFRHALKEGSEDESDTRRQGWSFLRTPGESISAVAESAAMPALAQADVQVKPLARPPQIARRLGLLISLVGFLLLACLLFAFVLKAMLNTHTQRLGQRPTPTSASGPFDLLASDQGNWPQSSTFAFLSGAYAIENTSVLGNSVLAFYENHYYGNFFIQVTTMEISGSLDGGDYYGVAFRAPLDESHYYLFDVTASGGGQYSLLRFDGQHWHTLGDGFVKNFHTHKGEANILSVEAKGTSFTLAINNKPVSKVITDNAKEAFSSGEIGLMVEERGSTIAFSHLYMSALP